MHPVIQKVIDIKWRLFGRLETFRKFFITLIYLICWLVLAYTFRDDRTFYTPWSSQGWKIAFEFLIIAFALYFFYKVCLHIIFLEINIKEKENGMY